LERLMLASAQEQIPQNQLAHNQLAQNQLPQGELAQNLHDTNRRLRFWLDSLVPEQATAGAATPQQMAGLLSELLRAGEWLRAGLPQERDSELETELGNYRRNVERLRELLPFIQRVLLREKARLETERARVECAAEWARGSRRTL
jgi:hypothetical protein